MVQVFLNHKTEEKTKAISIKQYLMRCLISCWLDSEEVRGGSKLGPTITGGIVKSRYFVALISYRYVRSAWCMHELQEAQSRAIYKKTIIIPVLLCAKDELNLAELPVEEANVIESILSGSRYILYDQYDPESSNAEIANAIGYYNQVQFEPVVCRTIQGSELQLLNFKVSADGGNLPTDILRTWDVNIEDDFLDCHGSDKAKPLQSGKPVSLSGKGPNWLYSHLSIKFKNQCPVYIFNRNSNGYICVYSPPQNSSHQQGSVLSEN